VRHRVARRAAGDVNGALESSRKAKLFAIISAAVGFVVIALYIVFAVVLVSNGDIDTTTTQY
jgi:t-SNARE complex subunit (syntaxin)